MTFHDWIHRVISTGNLCSMYTEKVASAMSKKEIMDIVLDANGVSFLLEMQEKGMGLPYETICKEFRPYINGRYIGEFKNERNNGYTSKIYCCYTEKSEIVVDTTAVVLLGCTGTVVIPENTFVKIYADKNCDFELFCPTSSKCIVEYSTGALIGVLSANSNIEFIDRGYGNRQNT